MVLINQPTKLTELMMAPERHDEAVAAAAPDVMLPTGSTGSRLAVETRSGLPDIWGQKKSERFSLSYCPLTANVATVFCR